MPGDPPPEPDKDDPDGEFVEIDPTRRYGRYRTILGKGAFKTVYKAFDEREGIEVAWNQVKVADVLRNCDDLERLYSEVHLLKTLKHKNIIKFYNSWVDIKRDNINFITEVFTSGTLRQFRKKHKHVELRALKNWSRQILSGLHYLHSHDPPVIHRDLKCDNLFVNGNQGEVKIGDLGLATILRHAHSAHSVIGTPEFMAPELYEEEYNELVDIYAFGMCLLELVTFEYPYSECTNAAQIYKKVTAGIKPASLSKVEDSSVKQFIEKCISDASERLPARELLRDPFLRLDAENVIIGRTLWPAMNHSGNVITRSNASMSNSYNKESPRNGRDFTVEGQRKDINTIFLKLRIVDSTGQVRNIHFPFDIEADTSISVATEMVAELDLTDQDVTDIAATIDAEIQTHAPEWMTADAVDDDQDKEVTVQDNNNPKAEDELSALRNESNNPSGGLVLERLSSGRRYWCDSPRETSSGSPSRLISEGDLHDSDDLSGEIFEKVENPIKYDDHFDHHSHDTSPFNQKSESQQFIDCGNVSLETIPSSTSLRSPSSSPKHVDNRNPRETDNSESVNNQRVASADQYNNGELCLHKTPMEKESEGANSVALKLEPFCVQPKESGFHPAEDKSSAFVGQYNIAIQSVTEKLEHLLVEQKNEPCLKSVENESEGIKSVIEKLTNLLTEQKKERVELKKLQDMAISSILEEVPPELREKTLIMCRLKVSGYKVHGKLQEHAGYSAQSVSLPVEELPSHSNSTIYNVSKEPEP